MRETRRAPASAPTAPRPRGTRRARLARLWREGRRPDLGAFLAGEGDLSPARARRRAAGRPAGAVGGRRSAARRVVSRPVPRPSPTIPTWRSTWSMASSCCARTPANRRRWSDYLARFPGLAAALELQVDFHRALGPAPTVPTIRTSAPSSPTRAGLGARPAGVPPAGLRRRDVDPAAPPA